MRSIPKQIRKTCASVVFCAGLIMLPAFSPTGGPAYDVTWHTIDGGGGTSTDGTYEVSGTAGQPDPIVLTGGGYELTGGFWSAFEALPCPADTDDNGSVEVIDLLALLAAWGACPTPPPPCTSDIDGNGTVEVIDLLALLAAWGVCP